MDLGALRRKSMAETVLPASYLHMAGSRVRITESCSHLVTQVSRMAEGSERRVAERFPVTSDTVCTFLSPVLEDFPPGRIKNVSSDGIGMILTEKVSAGLLLAVTLANPSRGFAKTMMVRVVHVTPQPGGTYLVGGTFETPLTYEELRCMVM